MLTSLSAGVLLNNQPMIQDEEITTTGTPADNFPDSQRAQFCGSSPAKSTPFIKEYSIPTVCTNPLAIVTDYSGNVWFAETNTGKLGKFDPTTESFTEFENTLWPKNGRSMIWGMDYSPDGSVWYTDESYDSIWKFTTDNQKYQRIDFPSEGDSLPQKLKILGSQVVVNDFNGNKLTFLDPTLSDKELSYLNIPSPVDGSVTGDFAIDEDNNVWYTNWIFQQGGVLVKFDQDAYRNSIATANENSLPALDFIEVFQLPVDLFTPNGLAVSNGLIWIADTSNSAIFTFNPDTNQFISYPTSDPKVSTYGNSTGVIKSPISRPYWIESNSIGQLVFNEQTANSIAVLDPKTDSLVEYLIPSKNPAWGDCDLNFNCGLAQVFDFAIYKDKIWFTEWVENKIGVVDTSVPLPFDVTLDTQNISLLPGESKNISLTITPQSTVTENVSLILSDYVTFLDATSDSHSFQLSIPKITDVKISASDEASPGTYKVLIGAQIEDVSISKFVTVTILP
ncbi:MAG: lyase [Nitrosarchaeum sp.]|nr:lyase [Nitrosarchaeum sp.]